MSSKFKDKMERGFSNFWKDPLRTVDFHVNSGINQLRFNWNKYGYRGCPTHSGGYDIGCHHCHHHNCSPPGHFPPGPPGGNYPPPGGNYPPPGGNYPPPGGNYPPPGPPSSIYPNPPNYPPAYPPAPSPGFPPSAPPPFDPGYPAPSYPYYWLDTYSSGGVPPQAFEGGHDFDGHRIYVGRAFHEGDWLPAKVIPGKRAAYVSYNGEEILKDRFQVLCGSCFYWQPDSNGSVPPRAVQGGRTSNGEPLYVGRVHHDGSLTVGKIHPSHGSCYIPFAGREHGHRNYEVLVSTQ